MNLFSTGLKVLGCLFAVAGIAASGMSQDDTGSPGFSKFGPDGTNSTLNPVKVSPMDNRFMIPNRKKEKPDDRMVGSIPVKDTNMGLRADSSLFETNAPPSTFRNFDGILATGWRPPDPEVAAGPSHLVAVTNSHFAIFTKDGTNTYQSSFASFMNSTQFLFDPKVAYDVFNDRFVILLLANIEDGSGFVTSSSYVLLYSDDSNPNGNWSWRFLNAQVDGATATPNFWADFPHLGIADGGLCLASIKFAQGAASGSYSHVRFLRTSEVYAGGGVNWWDYVDLASDGSDDKRPVPARQYSDPGAFYMVSGKEGGSTNVTIRRFTNYLFSGGGPTMTTTVKAVNAYAPNGLADQQGSATDLEANDGRVLSVSYANGNLFAVNGNRADWGDGLGLRSTVKAMCFDIYNSFNTLIDESFGNPGYDYYYPAISTNLTGDAVITFARSGATEYASCRVAGYKSGDTTFGGSVQVQAGLAPYVSLVGSRNRWGDYFGAGMDPWDNRTIWTIGQYASSTNVWRTRIMESNYKPFFVLTNANVAGQITDTVNLTTTLTRSDTSATLAGYTVNFTVGGVAAGSAVTNASGVATRSYTIPFGTPGSSTIGTSIDSSVSYNGTTDTSTLTRQKADTGIQISNETGVPGQTVIFDIQLIRATDSAAIASAPINVTINGVAQPVVNTNASGFAQLSYTITNNVGVYNATATYAGSTFYNPRTDNTGVLTVNKGATNILLNPQSGVIGTSVNLVATLQRTSDNTGLSGKTVSFAVGGVNVGSAVTNASGVATRSWVVTSVAPGSVLLEASWLGDTNYNADTSSSTFTRQSNTSHTLNSPSGQRTQVITFTSTLRRTWDNALLSGKTINFTVDGTGIGSAVTNASGVASINYAIPAGATLGAHTFAATFPAEALYTTSTLNGNWTVLSPSFNGRVNFLNWTGSESGRPLTITIRNAANTVVQGPTVVNTTASGNWTLATSLGAGTYKVSVKGVTWLRKQNPSVALNTTTGTALIVMDLINGDAVNDNVIDLSDYTVVAVAFNALLDTDPVTPGNQSSPNWNVSGDLDGNGVVDLTDYTIVATGFNLIGDN